jgi:hypothetical protein
VYLTLLQSHRVKAADLLSKASGHFTMRFSGSSGEEAVAAYSIVAMNLMKLIEKDKGSLKKKDSKEKENVVF